MQPRLRSGPGTVDPVTGQFALSSSDVDVAGAGAVSRTYLSRTPTVGSGGPLGPQWSLSTGMGQSLKLLPDGNAEFRGRRRANDLRHNGEGEFEAPKGDGNLTLEAKEKEPARELLNMFSRIQALGTSTIFDTSL